MKIFFAAPSDLAQVSHLKQAVELAQVCPEEVLLLESESGATAAWVRSWAESKGLPLRLSKSQQELLKLLAKDQSNVIIAVISPDSPSTLDLIAKAESARIPVFIYRALYRQDHRVNCRFSPVERPDVWLRALTAEQRDFFRRLHELCAQYKVSMQSGASGEPAILEFADGTQFEGVDVNDKACKVRPRGSFRYRKIRLESK